MKKPKGKRASRVRHDSAVPVRVVVYSRSESNIGNYMGKNMGNNFWCGFSIFSVK